MRPLDWTWEPTPRSKSPSPCWPKCMRCSPDAMRVRCVNARAPFMPDLATAVPTYRFGAVILAAGASVRMGTLKQLLPIQGQPLLVRAVEAALASDAWPVVVVLGAQAEAIRPALARLPVLIADNPAW